MAEGWLEVAKEAVKLPALLSDIYGDLLKPGVKQVGHALETVVGLGNTILWPISLANEKARIILKRNIEKYREQMESVPEEKVSRVPPELGVPIAEKLTYVSDDELSNLYINLLAKASSIDTAHFAHPSFVNVINNLSPDEALFMREIYKRGDLPFLTAQLTDKKTRVWHNAGDLLTGIENQIKLSFPNNATAYLSNFEGLGLIQVRRDIQIAKPELYSELEAIYRSQCEALEYDHETREVEYTRGKIEITPFGGLFMDACLTKLNEKR